MLAENYQIHRIGMLAVLALAMSSGSSAALADDADRIRPYCRNAYYWQYGGKPMLLLGGSKDDNLFQIPDLKEHLDLLASVGGNYIRNTMSARVDKGFEIQAFKRLPDGKYDLDQWNEDYWNRFERMLKLTRDRDIIVQIEIWAFHDFNLGKWEKNPWRPAGNINYTESNTTLKNFYGNIGRTTHDFFFTVPKLKNDRVVLRFQKKFVDKILSHSLRYGHVLYCMTNEIHPQYSPEWGWCWAGYIKDKAAAKGKGVEVSEMLWEIDLKKEQQRASFDRPNVYSFFEASQNSAKIGQENWDNLQFAHNYLAKKPRPINHVKIYGADSGTWKGSTDRHAIECFWRNIIGGSASSRFHRPPYGLGLSEKAQANIRSMRLLTDKMDIFTCAPHNDLLSERKPNGAYCLANPGKEYAVYFPSGGEVVLDISLLKEPATIRWLAISTGKWREQQRLKSARSVTLRAPDSGPWVVLLARGGGAGDATFTRTRLTTVAETNMGHVPVADINGDGVIDIVAGLQWFEGPSWRRHPLYPPDSKPTAIDIGFTVPYDLDGDGDPDLTTHRRSSDDRNKNELFWFENPGPPSTDVWTKHHITWDTRWPEVIIFVDIDGDGRDEMICSDVCPDKGIRLYEIPRDPENASSWSWTTVDKSPLHGLGIGDLNEDGRLDIVSDFVWFEQDARGGWIRHSLPSPASARRGHETMQIKVYDVDADGDADLILPRAHHYGAYWLESSGGKKPSFKLHEILPGKLPSQLHGVAYGDIDGDGDLDIFAGKSRYRHGDPGNDEPLDVFWIELVRSSGSIRWVKHQLATDLTMGIGPTIADVDADGDMDLVLRGHGIGGRYVIGTRQTDVTLFIQNASAAETNMVRGGFTSAN
ncbi:MAG: VCBS repeat-containing protein [Phycisphaerae bacterium]|nr:VCBS repeat-containing protein [Phycisphaerae bacterium]